MLNSALQNFVTQRSADIEAEQALVEGITDLSDLSDSQASALVAAQQKIAALQALAPAKTFTRLERNPWLIAPGTAANSGSVGSTAGITITPPSNLFSLVTTIPAGPYADKYAYQVLGADSSLVRFRQYGSIYFPSAADALAAQAWESDLPQKTSIAAGRYYFDWGMQYDWAENMLRVWNKAAGSWVTTGKPMPRFKPGTWVDHVIDCHRDGSNVIYDQLTVGGEEMLADVIDFPALLLTDTSSDILNYGLQPDGDKTADKYSAAIDNFGLIAWAA